jgi:hypothetical protein
MDDIIHPVSEFHLLPWDKLAPEQCTRSWSYGFGGHGLTNSEGTISIFSDKELNADIWVMPESLAALIRMSRQIGENEAKRKMREAMNL